MRSILAVLLAAVCFGTTGTAQALGPDAGAISIGAARILIGGAALAAIAGIGLARRRGRGEAAPGVGRPAHRLRALPTWLLLVAGAAGVIAYQPTFFAGTSINGVAIGTVIALGSAPVITGLLDWAVAGRRPGGAWAIATVVATLGVGMLAAAGGSSAGGDPLGILASLGAGASYAVYTIASKELIERGWSPNGAMGGMFGLAAAGSLPILLATDASWLATPDGLTVALWLGLVTTTLAYVLFGAGLKGLAPATVSTLTLSEPLTASLLGLLLLHEQLTALEWAGLATIAAGLVVLALAASSRPPRPSEAERTAIADPL
ncbi:DMT family transporter [Agromyces seonyuensis]|uniref:EamA family transporter n=1 Tax=Agromyces seonyuensis TaxID=2662446 RepID=A0A6I4P3Q0_9MICO|nr:EamA family transporter [Agromyces seonyuensis]MWB97864.1 EamA family transporter [Agromyces seonyuensis]